MKAETNRIEIAGQGVGEVNKEQIEQRARELAKSDGRVDIHAGDWAAARAELLGETSEAPEVTEVTSQLTAWDESPDSTGHKVEKVELEDEKNLVAELYEEGLEEADHNSRLVSGESEDKSS